MHILMLVILRYDADEKVSILRQVSTMSRISPINKLLF